MEPYNSSKEERGIEKPATFETWTPEDEQKLKIVKTVLEDMRRDPFKYFLIDKMNIENLKDLFGKDIGDVSLEDINSAMERYKKNEEQFIKEQRVLFEEEIKLKEKAKAVGKALVAIDTILLKKYDYGTKSESLLNRIVGKIKDIPNEVTVKERKDILDIIITIDIPEIVKICDTQPQPADFNDLLKNLFDVSGLQDISPERDSSFKGT